MKLFVRDKHFYRSFFSMTAVIALQNLISFAVNLADNVMIGGYSQDALSGVAMVNQIQFLLQMIVMGIGNGIVVLGAQYWGRKQVEPIRRVTSIGMVLAIAASFVMMLVVLIFPNQTLSILTNEPAVIAEGAKYLVIICFSYVLFAITNILLSALRSVETVKIGFVVTLTALVVNIALNYGLIYGRMGLPEMGVEGAALATLISRIVEFVIVVIFTFCVDQKIRWRAGSMLHLDGGLFKDYIRVGLPLILSNSIWGIAMAVQTAILGRLGSDTIAANSIATTIFQVVSVLSYGAASASGVVIGKTVGEGDIARVKAYSKTLQIIYIIIGVLTGCVLWLCKDFILGFYSITPQTHALAVQFIGVLSITVVGTSYQVACLTGIVTGGGDTRFVLVNDLIHQWLIVLPSAFLSAFVFHAPLWVTFVCLKSDQILKCFVAVVKVNRYRWIRVLTREDAAA
ncbi:MAG: MATE family efflux transporter, partial [Christensenellaceae bacterium]